MNPRTKKRATITDVAQHAGVSTGTVSAVLNKRSTVRDVTRKRVLRAIEDLEYRPTPSARILGSAQSLDSLFGKSVALLVKELDNPFFTEVALGAHTHLESVGYTTFVCTSEGDPKKEDGLVDTFRERFISGAIIWPMLHEKADLSHLYFLNRTGYPFVLLEEIPGLPVTVVSIDNVKASHTAVEYLISNGHHRVAHIGGPDYSPHSEARIRGFQLAFSESVHRFQDRFVVRGGARMEDGYKACLKLFQDTSAENRPTAITCFNDQVALGAIRALSELGLRVPDDVSIIGMDDIPSAAYLSVPLTTIRVPKREMGRIAAEILVGQIEGHNTRRSGKVILDAELVVRGSTIKLEST